MNNPQIRIIGTADQIFKTINRLRENLEIVKISKQYPSHAKRGGKNEYLVYLEVEAK